MDIHESSGPNPMIGRRIGVYQLEEEVGRGGMGAVYRAVRVDGEFDQTVAIKLIKRGMDTDLILKRFRNERQILAALSHPNIAFFIGGGTTRDGLPYFVMEYVDGLPLYAYCDTHHLSVRDRLKIFRQVCWAVSAAHSIKVIHRDLKPSNVLVKSDGKPKLLDFGIAKVLDPDLMVTEIDPTATERRVMTPEYASPEQISGEAITPASDIYALGVILYELLTGHRPYLLRRQLPDETARTIREDQPLPPSNCLTRDDNLIKSSSAIMDLQTVLDARGSSLEALRRELSGDLDKIVLKALRKSPAERYRNARDFADDITNFLERRPVEAEFFVSVANLPRPRPGDRVSIAVLPFTTLAVPTEGSGDEFLGIGLADALIARLSGISRLVVMPTSSVLGFVGQDACEAGRTLGVDYVLDGNIRKSGDRVRVSVQLFSVADSATRWAQAFDERESDLLALEDKISDEVAKSLLPQLTTEERVRLDRRGTNVPEAYRAYLRGRYFVNRFSSEQLPLAVDAFNEALRLDPEYAYPYIGLADVYVWSAIFGEIPSREALSKAAELVQRAIQINNGLGEAYAVLAFCVFLGEWNWADAEQIALKAIELSPHHPFAHECISNFYAAQGRFDEAVREIEKAEELDPLSPRAKLITGWTLYHARRYDEALEKIRSANRMQPNFPQGLWHLGNILAAVEKYDEAVDVLRKCGELWPGSIMPKYLLCFALSGSGNIEEAKSIANELSQRTNTKAYFAAMACVAAGQIDKAFDHFERAIEEHNEWMIWFGVEPKLDAIRNDSRYREVLRALNNPLATGEFRSDEFSFETDERIHSIAVLPFKLLGRGSDDSGDQFLSLGLADAVTMRLSNVGRFLVRPTSSVLSYSTAETDPFAAGRELGVKFVVDGIIRHVGENVRVTVQLLDVADNRIHWAASFDEKFTDVLELEDLISERVTRSLLPKITGEEEQKLAKRGTDNAAAHEAYLQGRYFWNQFTPAALQQAIAFFRKAIELDPNYAMAYVGLADFYSWAGIYGMIPPDRSFAEVSKAAGRAIELDDTLPEAHAAMGLYYSNSQDWQNSEREHRRAIELNPNFPLSHEWLSAVLVGTGRFEEGRKEILAAEALDPLSLRQKVLTAWTIYQTGDFSASLEKAEEIIAFDPKFWQGYLQSANILIEIGNVRRAVEHARIAMELGGRSPLPAYALCFALRSAGENAEALEIADSLVADSMEQYVSPYFIGMSLLGAGDVDRAFDFFEMAQTEKSAWMVWWATEPKLNSVRRDDRYWHILRKTGNPIIEQLERRAAPE
jgi:serine/threonine protein kinase/Flp pilus assembly protein TadD